MFSELRAPLNRHTLLTVIHEIPAPFELLLNVGCFVGMSRKCIKFPVRKINVSASRTYKFPRLRHSYPKECLKKKDYVPDLSQA